MKCFCLILKQMLPFHSCYFDIVEIDHNWASSSCTITISQSYLINKIQAWTGIDLVCAGRARAVLRQSLEQERSLWQISSRQLELRGSELLRPWLLVSFLQVCRSAQASLSWPAWHCAARARPQDFQSTSSTVLVTCSAQEVKQSIWWVSPEAGHDTLAQYLDRQVSAHSLY